MTRIYVFIIRISNFLDQLSMISLCVTRWRANPLSFVILMESEYGNKTIIPYTPPCLSLGKAEL